MGKQPRRSSHSRAEEDISFEFIGFLNRFIEDMHALNNRPVEETSHEEEAQYHSMCAGIERMCTMYRERLRAELAPLTRGMKSADVEAVLSNDSTDDPRSNRIRDISRKMIMLEDAQERV